MPAISHTKLYNDVEPLPNDILVVDIQRGGRFLKSGIIILDNNGKSSGIHPRWCRVYKVGKNVTDVLPDQYILVEHGRWTYGIEMELEDKTLYLQKVDPNGIMLVSDEEPEFEMQKGKEI